MIVLNEEQTMLRDMAESWVMDRAPTSSVRQLRTKYHSTGFDPALYAEMAEMGWLGIIVPEENGGVGLDFVCLGLIAEQLGRNLVASPLLSSAVGAVNAVLLGSNETAQATLLPQIADGSLIIALALDDGPHHVPENVEATARKTDNGWVLNGHKRAVTEAVSAQKFIVLASLEDGQPALLLCPADGSGVVCEQLNQIDSRGAGSVTFTDVPLDSAAMLGSGTEYVSAVLDRCRAVLAAEMLGGAIQAFETTLEYLKTRVQFDHPIGSFQALQHRAAEIVGEIELARSAVYGALLAIDSGGPDVAGLVSLAKAMTGDLFRYVAREMIQMHGGIGMTDEHDAGLYLKRAHTADHLLGNAAFHRERYADLFEL